MPLHPALLALPRQLLRSRAARAWMLALAGIVLAPLMPWPLLELQRLHDALGWLAVHPFAAAVISGLCAHVLAMPALRAELQRWRHGAWAALPIPESRVMANAALLASGVALASAIVSWSTLALAAVLAGAPRVGLPGVLAGCAAAAVAACVHGLARRPAMPPPITRRSALWTLRWIDDPGLPHLADWQRRLALQQWRGRTVAPVVGGMLLATPASAGPAGLVAVVVVAWAAWFLVAMRASARVHGEARVLLRAQPLAAARIATATLRYPAFAMASTLLALGLVAFAGSIA